MLRLNKPTDSMRPILSDTFRINDFRDSLTVLDDPNVKIHDSKLSFALIPLRVDRPPFANNVFFTHSRMYISRKYFFMKIIFLQSHICGFFWKSDAK